MGSAAHGGQLAEVKNLQGFCGGNDSAAHLGNGDMASDSSSSRSGGIGFVGLLTILFIGLKLTGHIQWSWLWVLSPIWIMAIVVVVLLLMVVAVTILEERRR